MHDHITNRRVKMIIRIKWVDMIIYTVEKQKSTSIIFNLYIYCTCSTGSL